MSHITFAIEGVNDPRHARRAEEVLKNIERVAWAKVDHSSGKLTVTYINGPPEPLEIKALAELADVKVRLHP